MKYAAHNEEMKYAAHRNMSWSRTFHFPKSEKGKENKQNEYPVKDFGINMIN